MACPYIPHGDLFDHPHALTLPDRDSEKWNTPSRARMSQWLVSEEAVGTFTDRTTRAENVVAVMYFSDLGTAMAFKLRFL